jgi:hypothetical protein
VAQGVTPLAEGLQRLEKVTGDEALFTPIRDEVTDSMTRVTARSAPRLRSPT